MTQDAHDGAAPDVPGDPDDIEILEIEGMDDAGSRAGRGDVEVEFDEALSDDQLTDFMDRLGAHERRAREGDEAGCRRSKHRYLPGIEVATTLARARAAKCRVRRTPAQADGALQAGSGPQMARRDIGYVSRFAKMLILSK